ncbi:spore cortex biosynthesis protein YabQ [Rossellomorea sp. BNER]|uniref:spore cortex biosynthesis protein YabQ n=1 Tax=Rossellomorea sp. BNER TaxID=2962031 RepID=UPI003AF2B9CA|nr:spore cortex biosynthesis protein YabQ [Rossellomorea sp. BNER]
MTLTTQFYTMLAMVGMGALFGAMLDTYQRFLNRSARKKWLVFLNDFLFWILQALLIFYILFSVNFGEVRIYIFLALLCGFSAYQALLKRNYLHLLEIMIKLVISIYDFIVKVLKKLVYSPIKWMIFLIISLVLFLLKSLLSLILFIFKIIRFFVKLILKPFHWIGKLLWHLVPKNIKNIVEKLYNKWAGFLDPFVKVIKTSLKNVWNKWFQKTKKK